MTRIFISYARKDASPIATKIYHELTYVGYAVWMDRESLQPGKDYWDARIEAEIFACDIFIALISNDVAEREKSIVRDEIDWAITHHKLIIPIRIHKEAKLMRLHRVEFIDFSGDPIQGMKKLIHTIQEWKSTMTLQITDLMDKNFSTIRANADLHELYDKMYLQGYIYVVVVNDDGTIVGFLTRGDLADYIPPKVAGKTGSLEERDRRLSAYTVGQFIRKMRRAYKSFQQDTSILEAIDQFIALHGHSEGQFHHRIRSFPVLDEMTQMPIGVLGYWALIDGIISRHSNFLADPVHDFLYDDTDYTNQSSATIRNVYDVSRHFGLAEVAILDGNDEFLGFITRERMQNLVDDAIREYMKDPVSAHINDHSLVSLRQEGLVLTGNEPLIAAARKFTESPLGMLPILDGKKLKGVITYFQILRKLKEEMSHP